MRQFYADPTKYNNKGILLSGPCVQHTIIFDTLYFSKNNQEVLRPLSRIKQGSLAFYHGVGLDGIKRSVHCSFNCVTVSFEKGFI